MQRAGNEDDTKGGDHVPFPSNIVSSLCCWLQKLMGIKQEAKPPLLDTNTTSSKDGGSSHGVRRAFTFQELAGATKNFGADSLIGEGEAGKVYKGWLESSNQIVTIKQFNDNRVFLTEMLMLSFLRHQNLVDQIGYCAEGVHRLLVYEYMPLGSLQGLLFDLRPDQAPLDWEMRMKIAAGISSGLEYMQERENIPVIHRNLKCSNILLNKEYCPVLSDFGLAMLEPTDGETFVHTEVVGTAGYIAPEYEREGLVSLRADVYSFGVVLLEIITGRKAIDMSRAPGERNIVSWVCPLLKDRRNFPSLVDPVLQGRYPFRGLCDALAIAAMCTQEKVSQRPRFEDVTPALSYVALHDYERGEKKIEA